MANLTGIENARYDEYMDSKKTLKPELKDIYERVMNTNTASRTSQSTTPSQPPVPAQPPTPVQPAPSQPVNSPAQPTNSATSPIEQLPKEPFLASSAPRPLNDSATFVFSSHGSHPKQEHKEEPKKEHHHEEKKDATDSQKHEAAKTKKTGSSKMPIIIVLMIVFLVIWTVIWMYALKLI